MNTKLTGNFLQSLFVLLFRNKEILEVCNRYLKFSFIPKELPEFKIILKSIFQQYELTGKIPDLGIVSQQYASNSEVQEALVSIKQSDLPENIEGLIDELEKYIKNVEFQLLNEKVVDLYKKEQLEEAIQVNAEESQRINEISIRDEVGKFTRLFNDFNETIAENRIEAELEKSPKVPFFIDPLDSATDGGMDETEIALIISQSGYGKSTFLKWVGMQATLHGYDPLHIQLEGSKKEAVDKYNQIWTKLNYGAIKYGDIEKEALNRIQKALQQMKVFVRELFIYAYEVFGGASMIDIRSLVLEYFRIRGKYPDLILIDSIELVNTGINKMIDENPAYLKHKLQRVAQLIKNIAVEFKTRVLVSAQTGDLAPLQFNDENFVITRHNTEGDRTLVKPFSFVFTWNMTRDEKKVNEGRLFIDKLRNYDPKDIIFKIKTAFSRGAFYDRRLSMKKYYSEEAKATIAEDFKKKKEKNKKIQEEVKDENK